MSVLKARMAIITGLLITVGIIWLPQASIGNQSECYCLKVSFLNVGQGDAILIQTPDGIEVLIDGGPDAGVLRELSKNMSAFDRSIDVVVATHPDSDHIGGLVDVFERYEIGQIIETKNINNTPAFSAYNKSITEEKTGHAYAQTAQKIKLGEDTYLYILSPTGTEENWESNTASVVLQVVYGDTTFMLTGDAPISIEDYLVNLRGSDLKSDVLKLGHHGSKTSTSDLFLEAVDPEYAVVSAGIDNRYGHPHQEVMARVFARNIQTSHTGTDGTITFYSDGSKVWQK